MNSIQRLVPFLIIVAIVGLGTGGYFFSKYQKAQKEIQTIKTDPTTIQKAAQEETKKLLAEISKLIDLPSGEEPTVATVTDIEKLKDQPFFAKAKNGDKVIIYTNAKKAILYDPTAKKIIDVAPVNIGTGSAQIAPVSTKIVLRNGTTTTGLTNKIEPEVKKALPQAEIASKDSSSKTDYEKSVIVVLNDKSKDSADSLAKALNIGIGELPQGEAKPQDGDILVILGKDKSS
jgi:hypothetical protein